MCTACMRPCMARFRVSFHTGPIVHSISTMRVIYGSEGFVEADSALDGHPGARTAPAPPQLSALILVTSKNPHVKLYLR